MIRITAVGKMKDKRLAGLVDDYLRRCRPLARVQVVEVKDSRPEREARDLLGGLGAAGGTEVVVALDERGEAMTSAEFARLLGTHGSLSFIIGGADGLDDAVKDRANRLLRLSSMTLPHELARVMVAEQIYRGLSILRGLPYHRA